MDNMKAIPVTDEALEAAAGGRVQQGAWADYAQQYIIPCLRCLSGDARGNDAAIVSECLNAMCNSTMPGEPITKIVKRLWNSYDASAFENPDIARRLYVLLDIAHQYILQHS